MASRTVVVLLGVLALGLAGQDARAETCPSLADTAPDLAPGSIGVGDVDARDRLDYLARAFDREIYDIDVWSWTWGSIYTAGAIGEAAALPLTSNQGTRTGLYVGVVSTAFGAVSLYGLPLQLTLPLRSARRRWNDADRCATLARAERTLVSVDSDQRLATGILGHVGNVLVNVGIGLILGLGYHQWTSAGISFGVGVVIGEANAFTQPHHLSEVLASYRAGRLDSSASVAPTRGVAWALMPIVTPRMSGVGLGVSW